METTLGATFAWTFPHSLTSEIARELGMVKGVCCIEGTSKSGYPFTKEDIIQGAGAMRAASLMMQSSIGVDHHAPETGIPASYSEKYPGLGKGEYPIGDTFDAQPVEHNGKWQVEFLAFIWDPVAYDLIKNHQFVGCSVEDYIRHKSCICKDDGCTCRQEGSAFLTNTLVLEHVPDIDGTWVDVIDSSDIGSILINTIPPNKHTMTKLDDKIKHALSTHNLSDYYVDAAWVDGATSAVEYLTKEKDIDEAMAGEIAAHLVANPGALNEEQLMYLSTLDIETWWGQHILATHSAKFKAFTLTAPAATEPATTTPADTPATSTPPADTPSNKPEPAATTPTPDPATSTTDPATSTTDPEPMATITPPADPPKTHTVTPPKPDPVKHQRPRVETKPDVSLHAVAKLDEDIKDLQAKNENIGHRLYNMPQKWKLGKELMTEYEVNSREIDRLIQLKKKSSIDMHASRPHR